MAKARGPRPRALSFVFGAYFLLMTAVAFFLSPHVTVYVDPGATFWICAAYVLLGALVLVGVCVGALRRWARLDARIAELEDAQRVSLGPATPGAEVPTSRLEASPPGSLPTDRDVERLLTELHAIGEAGASGGPLEEPEGPRRHGVEVGADLRDARGLEIARLRKVRDAVAITAAGPAVASIGLLGVFAALLPASDGMLLANLQLNAFVGLAGLGWLVGLLAYAGAAFARRGRRGS